MKVGSLVECIDDNFRTLYYDEKCPKKGKIYTIRSIRPSHSLPGSYAILLEEIINPKQKYNGGFMEFAFVITRFREIEFPPSLESEIKESLTRELITT